MTFNRNNIATGDLDALRTFAETLAGSELKAALVEIAALIDEGHDVTLTPILGGER